MHQFGSAAWGYCGEQGKDGELHHSVARAMGGQTAPVRSQSKLATGAFCGTEPPRRPLLAAP